MRILCAGYMAHSLIEMSTVAGVEIKGKLLESVFNYKRMLYNKLSQNSVV